MPKTIVWNSKGPQTGVAVEVGLVFERGVPRVVSDEVAATLTAGYETTGRPNERPFKGRKVGDQKNKSFEIVPDVVKPVAAFDPQLNPKF